MRGDFEGVLQGDLWGWNGGGQLPTSHRGMGTCVVIWAELPREGGIKGQKGSRGGWMTSMPIPRTGRGLWGVLVWWAGYQSGMMVELIVGRSRGVGGGAHRREGVIGH